MKSFKVIAGILIATLYLNCTNNEVELNIDGNWIPINQPEPILCQIENDQIYYYLSETGILHYWIKISNDTIYQYTDEALSNLRNYFTVNFDKVENQLTFKSKNDKFGYIKINKEQADSLIRSIKVEVESEIEMPKN